MYINYVYWPHSKGISGIEATDAAGASAPATSEPLGSAPANSEPRSFDRLIILMR